MKKLILLIIALICFANLFSQNKSIDSTAIGFKAKLFTVSEFGISDSNEILKDIENQKIKFLKTQYLNFIFMKVEFEQPYRMPDNRTQTLSRECNYYIAFNIVDSRYYKLGGFNTLEVDAFFEDLEMREGTYFKDISGGNEIEEIDIYCLYEYYKMNQKKRFRKGFKCLNNCKDLTQTKIRTFVGSRTN